MTEDLTHKGHSERGMKVLKCTLKSEWIMLTYKSNIKLQAKSVAFARNRLVC